MGEASRKTILLVEDEAIIALEKALVLEKSGYEVITARSGLETLEKIRSNPGIDLVLMDIDLGDGMDGAQTAVLIAKERNVPILFLSNHTEPEIVEKTEGIASYGYVVKSGGDVVLLISIKMALRLYEARMLNQRKTKELEEANEKLAKNEAEFRSLFEAAPAGVGLLKNRRIQKVNAAMCELLGYAEDELLGESTRILYSTEAEFQRIGAELYGDLKGKIRSVVSAVLVKKDGSPVDVLIGASSIVPLGEDPVKGVAIVAVDISDLKRMEGELRETQDFLYKSQEIGMVGSYVLSVGEGDPARETWRGTPMMERIFGIGPDYPHTGQGWLDLIVQRAEIKSNFQKLNRNRVPLSDVLYQIIRHNDGAVRWIHSLGQLEFDGNGVPVRRVGTIQDITEQMNIQQDLDAALHEQETLLLELQHRVKNSFALIAGIVGLEAGRVVEDRMQEILERLKDRILSLASLYDLLFRSDNSTKVSLDEYFHSILESLSVSFVEDMGRIGFEESMEAIEANTKSSTAWGLILNELVTNALKYAFPGGRSGAVRIDLKADGGDIVLSVSDDGVGVPAGFDLAESRGLGLNMVKMMAEQLGGSLDLTDGKTKTFRVRAPMKRSL